MKKEKENLEIKLLQPFGPRIFKTKIPTLIIDQLNQYTEKIANDNEKSKKLDNGGKLAGNVTQEFILEKEFAKDSGWLNFLYSVSSAAIKNTLKKDVTSFDITSTWIVRQFKNEYNPIHNHIGHLSGVGYLKVPFSFGDTVQKKEKTRNKNGKLMFVHGSHQFMSNSNIEITPEVGSFYLFPSYLLHLVNPFFDTNEERRSISFNALINNDIVNEN